MRVWPGREGGGVCRHRKQRPNDSPGLVPEIHCGDIRLEDFALSLAHDLSLLMHTQLAANKAN